MDFVVPRLPWEEQQGLVGSRLRVPPLADVISSLLIREEAPRTREGDFYSVDMLSRSGRESLGGWVGDRHGERAARRAAQLLFDRAVTQHASQQLRCSRLWRRCSCAHCQARRAACGP